MRWHAVQVLAGKDFNSESKAGQGKPFMRDDGFRALVPVSIDHMQKFGNDVWIEMYP